MEIDWKVCLQTLYGIDFAVFTDGKGNLQRTLGNALADDSNYTNSTLQGSTRALEVAATFFAFMGGCLNLDKTNLSILDWVLRQGSFTGRYKLLCPPEGTWDPEIHLPATVQVLDPRTLDRLETTQALLDSAQADGAFVCATAWPNTTAPTPTNEALIAALTTRLAKLETQRYAVVNVLSPDDAVKYLGVWLPISLRYHKALDSVRTELATIAECLQCASITPEQLKETVRMTAMQVGSWRMRMTSLFPEQLDRADSRLTEVVKQKTHLCSRHPTLAFAATMHTTLTNQILVDRVAMFLRMISARHSISDAMQGSLWTLQRWVGSSTPVLEYEHVETIGWNGTWVGSLAICIRRQNISIVGGKGIPLMRAGDACLVDLRRRPGAQATDGDRVLDTLRLAHQRPAQLRWRPVD